MCSSIRHGNHVRRNEWCWVRATWTQEQYDKILFCDDSRFGLRLYTRRVKVYRRLRNAERLRYVQEVHPYKDFRVMVWADIIKNKQSEIVL